MAVTAASILHDIIVFVQTLIHVQNGVHQLWDSRSFNLSQYEGMEGFLTIENPTMSLTMGPFEVFSFAKVVEDDNGDFQACIDNVTFPQFNFTFNYEADVGINDEIPFYGKGTYEGKMTDVQTTFCWLLASTADEILDFDIRVIFRHQPSFLTGVFFNNEIDGAVANLLTLAKRLLAMWNNYETECASVCLLNPVFYFMTNILIYDKDKSAELTFEECSCIHQIIQNSHDIFGPHREVNLQNIFNYALILFEDALNGGLQLNQLESILP
ncbi:uncharacterized protein LOC126743704 [Anthonomus grandis grandis]|uniref:uncharacterized protein LOC126743704 n=1 Tax=Anthonomus grandis grandis TaxID=2921223 RepID=UPI00216511FC|nr:uncharacterized protein LOC126743704 [Anthonomus grandis grandis]